MVSDHVESFTVLLAPVTFSSYVERFVRIKSLDSFRAKKTFIRKKLGKTVQFGTINP